MSTIPVAQQAYRLRLLQRNIERAESRGNAAMVAALLEQAAKEVGGAFTNRRELTGKGGGPIAQHNVSPEELAAAVRSVRQEFSPGEAPGCHRLRRRDHHRRSSHAKTLKVR